ncbi:MAG: hypothetical protein H6667_18505 [Ardenticatenaceae bacterium]|nr:hypothetical protein [Ardenticatenaceae bacterium]MCB9445732.1 hypothetical protein [Ardenticatenaceae bacterium]
MANKKVPKKKKEAREEKEPQKVPPITNEPWIAKRTGLLIITFMSLGFTIFVSWQLYPTEGFKGLLWGAGIGLSLWVVFLLSLGFNKLVRRQ